MNINQQPIEKTCMKDDVLEVHSVWSTIQGEGPFAGRPAVFIRLAGCNLQCPACDTDYTSRRNRMTPSALQLLVTQQGLPRRCPPLVVLTGGEPFRQPLRPLTNLLLRNGFAVQVETNGTLFQELSPEVTIVCSPKTGEIHRLLMPRLAALKYVLQAGEVDAKDGLPITTLCRTNRVARPSSLFSGEIYVQPLDEQNPEANKRNMEVTVASVMKFGHRLCLQTHKIVGLP